MNNIMEKLGHIGIVPVVVINNKNKAENLADSLIKGGLPCAEVTFRTEAAEESIRIMAKNFPNMIVGAGTVLSIEQVDRAIGAGVKFIVSPCFNPKVVSYCLKNDYAVCPGIITPSELDYAREMGLDVVKFFPSEQAGGLKMIKAMSAPFPMMKFMPTGGINGVNVKDYLACDKIVACGGSWMVKSDFIDKDNFVEIEKLTKEASEIVKEIRG